MSYRVIVIGLFFLLPERSVPVRCALEDGFRRMVVVVCFLTLLFVRDGEREHWSSVDWTGVEDGNEMRAFIRLGL